ncbi:retron system putative HNH endonuclease [Polyangium sp. y55x31]|uniref:retron system putative HNH endonuclease n=1 Tax=Polyangium sp. y55x31 TaxID=3042688 RepID=UPI00248249D6|nr:retron system putative HNH endonuclease [Polyangium sp. y55x31]MDI1477758.1 TIGR02646 family protein [Polyangium sp. y55x31]
MRLVRKGNEPKELLAYRLLPHASYEGLPSETKVELRSALVRDQGALCCYCMQRITGFDVRIEHLRSQSNHPELQLSWNNLLAACHGSEGRSPDEQHCDVRKGDRDITLSPFEAKHIASLRYAASGEIRSSDPALQRDIGETGKDKGALNLNHPTLRRNRKEAVEALIDALHRKKSGAFSPSFLRAELTRCTQPDAKGQLTPFVGALVYWLEKRLGPAHRT